MHVRNHHNQKTERPNAAKSRDNKGKIIYTDEIKGERFKFVKVGSDVHPPGHINHIIQFKTLSTCLLYYFP